MAGSGAHTLPLHHQHGSYRSIPGRQAVAVETAETGAEGFALQTALLGQLSICNPSEPWEWANASQTGNQCS